MSEQNMPATEAAHYELAFHVLPTVAEGEVATIFQTLKDTIGKAGGEVTNEEAPERFELAYEIIKHLEGRNRKFTSAYFGWIRFTLAPDQLAHVSEAVDGTKELLRHLLIRLTKAEEENPFFFHEALAAQKQVETVEAAPESETPDVASEEKVDDEEKTTEDGEAESEKVE